MPRPTGTTNIHFEGVMEGESVFDALDRLNESDRDREAGDFITREAPRPKKKVVRVPLRNLKRMVDDYAVEKMDEWFKENDFEEEFNGLLVWNEDRDGYDAEKINEWAVDNLRDEFIEKSFNDFETGDSFFASNECSLGHEFNVNNFVNFWTSAVKWYKDTFDTDIEMKHLEHAWNTIAYWIINDLLYDEFEEMFVNKYKNKYYAFKQDKLKPHRLSCGVCYEKKQLFTGCYTCNGNYICETCFNKLSYNEDDEGFAFRVYWNKSCPFCRCDKMINPKRIHLIVEGFDKVLKELKSVKI